MDSCLIILIGKFNFFEQINRVFVMHIMTKVILDIPPEKMTSFIQTILQLGIDSHAIASQRKQGDNPRKRKSPHRFMESVLLFDWEFFSNELEYE